MGANDSMPLRGQRGGMVADKPVTGGRGLFRPCAIPLNTGVVLGKFAPFEQSTQATRSVPKVGLFTWTMPNLTCCPLNGGLRQSMGPLSCQLLLASFQGTDPSLKLRAA